MVAGLTAGAQYTISFEFTNLGLYNAGGTISRNAFNVQSYDAAGRWLVAVDGLQIGASEDVNFFERAGQQQWSTSSVTFTASAESHELSFVADWVSGNGTHVGMGIDGISLTLVPAPGAVTLAALAGLLGCRRRR